MSCFTFFFLWVVSYKVSSSTLRFACSNSTIEYLIFYGFNWNLTIRELFVFFVQLFLWLTERWIWGAWILIWTYTWFWCCFYQVSSFCLRRKKVPSCFLCQNIHIFELGIHLMIYGEFCWMVNVYSLEKFLSLHKHNCSKPIEKKGFIYLFLFFGWIRDVFLLRSNR